MHIAFGPLETALLHVVWASNTPVTVKQLHASLGGSEAMAYTTVMTTAARLAEKGLLQREQSTTAQTAPFYYRATLTKTELLAASIAEMCLRLNISDYERRTILTTFDVAPTH